MGLYRRNMKSQASDLYPSPLFSPLPRKGGKNMVVVLGGETAQNHQKPMSWGDNLEP